MVGGDIYSTYSEPQQLVQANGSLETPTALLTRKETTVAME
jgi:hypothetical protein